MTKVLIFCAGFGRRWNDFKGIRKHMIMIDGETLLDRMIRQCHELTECEIIVNGPFENNEWYNRPGAILNPVEARFDECPAVYALDKCLNSINQWSLSDRTVCLLGDVWYEDKDMEHVMNSPWKTFVVYNRAGKSHLTNKAWGEDYACSFYPKDHPLIKESLDSYSSDEDITPWDWVEKKFMERDNKKHRYETTGFTEDFDLPNDLFRWLKARDKYRYEKSCCIVKGI